MNADNLILWGFASTIVLTTVMVSAKYIGLTRIDLPFMLGTLFTNGRDKAVLVGFITHVIMGWIFALVYAAAFASSGLHHWWFGAMIGFVHAAFVLTVGLQVLNAIHPRMARPHQGPTPTRQLEPPGFLALNYGKGTPIATFLAHLVYGTILGSFL